MTSLLEDTIAEMTKYKFLLKQIEIVKYLFWLDFSCEWTKIRPDFRDFVKIDNYLYQFCANFPKQFFKIGVFLMEEIVDELFLKNLRFVEPSLKQNPTFWFWKKIHPPHILIYWFLIFLSTSLFIPSSTFFAFKIFVHPFCLFLPLRLLERWE